MTQEEKMQLNAQKKIHAALFALNSAVKENAESKEEVKDSGAKIKALRLALKRSIMHGMSTQKAAKARIARIKRESSLAEHHQVKQLKHLAETRIMAMAKSAKIIAQKL